MKIAQEAAELANDLREPVGDPFAAMEDNIDRVVQARLDAHAYLDQMNKVAFMAALPSIKRASLAERLVGGGMGEGAGALEDHLRSRAKLNDWINGAMADLACLEEMGTLYPLRCCEEDVEAEEREQLGCDRPPNPEPVAAKLGERLRWIDGARSNIGMAMRMMGRSGMADAPEVGVAMGMAEKFTSDIRTDANVQAAGQMVLSAGQDAAASETDRLVEHQRHVAALQAIQKESDNHDVLFKEIIRPAMMWVVTDSQFDDAWKKLGYPCVSDASCAPPPVKALKNLCLQPEWRTETGADRTFFEFVQAKFATTAAPVAVRGVVVEGGQESEICSAEKQARSAEEVANFIANLGFILFVESPFDLEQELAAATELHRHSIRLSRINSQQRLGLVGQVATALQIYYQGGITPGQAAQAVLMAANVFATGYIGSQL